MRALLLSMVAFAAPPGAVFAADLPPAQSSPVLTAPASVFSWAGFYVGAYAGGAFGSVNVFVPATGLHHNESPSGGAVGGLAGYNYQFNPSFLIGVEGEGGWQGYSQSINFISGLGDPATQHIDTDYTARIRGRLGYTVDKALFFAAGGASFSALRMRLYDIPDNAAFSISKDYAGWNIGGGVDYAFTSNWIGRIEYIYDGYGTKNYTFGAMTGLFARHDVRPEQSTVRAALIYKFGAPEPVVAKY